MAGPFHPRFEDLPNPLPIMPLSGVVLLPGGKLPLNIFEPRYLALFQDALAAGRMVGMVQPTEAEALGVAPPVYGTGCAGRISAFNETDDGRLLVTLTGVCRFRIAGELAVSRGYRRVVPDYGPFRADLDAPAPPSLDRKRLFTALKLFFRLRDVSINWRTLEAAGDAALVNTLVMICPLEPREKQALLEAPTPAERCELIVALLEMAVFESARPAVARQ